jgi:hypothetical protein
MRGFTVHNIQCSSYPDDVIYYDELFMAASVIQIAIALIYCLGCWKSNRVRGHPYFSKLMYRSDHETAAMHYSLHEPQSRKDTESNLSDFELVS